MSWKIIVVILVLLWLWRRNATAAPQLPAAGSDQEGLEGFIPEPSGSVDTGTAAVTFHEQSGVWSDVWKKPSGQDTGCYLEPDEFGGQRYVCP